MEEFWILILVAFIATNSLDKAESVKVKLEKTPLKTFDEIFGEGWWDKGEAEDLKMPAPTNFGQNVHHQIDRQNTQIGQIEPNSTDQNPPLTESGHSGQSEPNTTDQNPSLTESDHSGQIEPNSTDQNPPLTEFDHSGQIKPNSTDQHGQIESNSTDQNLLLTESDHSGQSEPNSTDQNPSLTESDHSGQIETNSTDQNPPLTESDHSGQIEPNSTDQNPALTEFELSVNAKNGEEQNEIMKKFSSNENIVENERKRKIITKFHEMKDELKQIGKFPRKEKTQIEDKIAKGLKVNRSKIYKWKKELGLSRKMHNFGKIKNDLKNLVEKFDQRKAELTRAGFKNSYHNQINETVAKELGLGLTTIYNWKSELGQTTSNKYSHSKQKEMMKLYYKIKNQKSKISDKEIAKMLKIGSRTLCRWKRQFKRGQLNSVDGHSVEENVVANVQEIGNINSDSS